MANLNLEQQIRTRISSFSDELASLVKQAALESVQSALGAPAHRGPGRPRTVKAPSAAKTARSAAGGKRTSEQIDALAGKLLTAVRSKQGQTIEQIGKGLSIHTKELKLPVLKLLEGKQIKTTGQKRGTKYFVR